MFCCACGLCDSYLRALDQAVDQDVEFTASLFLCDKLGLNHCNRCHVWEFVHNFGAKSKDTVIWSTMRCRPLSLSFSVVVALSPCRFLSLSPSLLRFLSFPLMYKIQKILFIWSTIRYRALSLSFSVVVALSPCRFLSFLLMYYNSICAKVHSLFDNTYFICSAFDP